MQYAALPSNESLRCFVVAARTLHFRKAARQVALTPAAFGQRIKQLEEALGAALFSRTTRSVVLTQEGIALLPQAEAALGALEACGNAIKGEAGPSRQEITLGTRHELGMSWLIPQYDKLCKERPWMELHYYYGSGSDLVLRLRTHEIDCAVTSTRLTDPKLHALQLHREDYVLCASKALLAKQPFTKAEHAEAHTLIDISSDLPLFRYWKDAPQGGDRLQFKSMVYFGGIDAIRARLVAGAGVGVLPLYLVQSDLKKGTLREVLPNVKPVHDWFRLVFRANDPRRPLFESLAESLRKEPLR